MIFIEKDPKPSINTPEVRANNLRLERFRNKRPNRSVFSNLASLISRNCSRGELADTKKGRLKQVYL